MNDFWLSSGHHLLDRDEGGGLLVTDEFLKVYLARPELAPPPDACVVERTLHAALLSDPRRAVEPGEIAAIADADARENYRIWLRFRDRLLVSPDLESAYMALFRGGGVDVPPLFVQQLTEMLGLAAFRNKFVSEISTGTRRMVDLACILAQQPKILLLDEPSGGVAQKETEALGPLLLRIREHTGCSMLVIEHDMPMISSVCDRLVALELGAVIAEGTPQEVLSHPAVIASYLGTDDAAIARSGTRSG